MRTPPMSQPVLIRARADDMAKSAELASLVQQLRRQADAFVFLSGGAGLMPQTVRAATGRLFDCLPLLARQIRLAVGDGGTNAGVMAEAGLARQRSGNAFPLIGIAPAQEIDLKTSPRITVEPHHSHVVVVDNESWEKEQRQTGWVPSDGYWGAELEPMCDLFDQLSADRGSVALIVNGGLRALDEVSRHVAANRPTIVISGSGRAADALAAALHGGGSGTNGGSVAGGGSGTGEGADDQGLRQRAESLRLGERRHLFTTFPLSGDPHALANLIAARTNGR